MTGDASVDQGPARGKPVVATGLPKSPSRRPMIRHWLLRSRAPAKEVIDRVSNTARVEVPPLDSNDSTIEQIPTHGTALFTLGWQGCVNRQGGWTAGEEEEDV